ncbi:MAG: MgtC/SapB family protein, partial [Vulcanimicrobiaceae bacterium]
SRIAAQVASGVGFLGAGTIILRREIVRGLTTAASIWIAAAIGLAAGAGLFVAAIVAAILVLLVLAAMRPIEKILFTERRRIRIVMTCSAHAFAEERVREIVNHAGAQLQRIDLRFDNDKNRDRIELVLRHDPGRAASVAQQLRTLDGVREVRTTFEGLARVKAQGHSLTNENTDGQD